jgi:hypothetical protein
MTNETASLPMRRDTEFAEAIGTVSRGCQKLVPV